MVTDIFVGQYKGYFEGNLLNNQTLSWTNGASKSAFRVSMATDLEFLNSDKFSAHPVQSPSNRAVNEVSRPNGCPRRAFVTGERL